MLHSKSYLSISCDDNFSKIVFNSVLHIPSDVVIIPSLSLYTTKNTLIGPFEYHHHEDNNQENEETYVLENIIVDFDETEIICYYFIPGVLPRKMSFYNDMDKLPPNFEFHQPDLSFLDVMYLIRKIKKIGDQEEDDENNLPSSRFLECTFTLIDKYLQESIEPKINQYLQSLNYLQKYNSLCEYVQKKQYIHVGFIEVNLPRDQSFTAAGGLVSIWIKLLSNISFSKISHSSRRIIRADTGQPSRTIEIANLLDECDLELVPIPSRVSNGSPNPIFEFKRGFYHPKGPKTASEFPIGNKQYEYLECELHLEYHVSSHLLINPAAAAAASTKSHKSSSRNQQQKLLEQQPPLEIGIYYLENKIGTTFLEKMDSKDWSHYLH